MIMHIRPWELLWSLPFRAKLSMVISFILALVFTAFFYEDSISVILIVIIGIIIWFILFAIVYYTVNRIYKRMCSYEVEAEVLFSQVDSIGSGKTVYDVYYHDLSVKYEYNGKVYVTSLKAYNHKDRRAGSKMKLHICKYCPKIVRVEEDNLNTH